MTASNFYKGTVGLGDSNYGLTSMVIKKTTTDLDLTREDD